MSANWAWFRNTAYGEPFLSSDSTLELDRTITSPMTSRSAAAPIST